MKKEQRICVLLAIMILGIWGLEAKSSGSLIPKSWKIRMIQSVQENAERLYMPGVTYTEKKQGEIRVTEAVVHMASALIPLGNYVTEREAAELLTEDEATYAILAKKQAEEENSVDENGQLIGKDKSEETRQASVPTMDLSMERLNDFEFLYGGQRDLYQSFGIERFGAAWKGFEDRSEYGRFENPDLSHPFPGDIRRFGQ